MTYKIEDVIMNAEEISRTGRNITYPSRVSAQYVRNCMRDLLALVIDLRQTLNLEESTDMAQRRSRLRGKRAQKPIEVTGEASVRGHTIHINIPGPINFPKLVTVPQGQKAIVFDATLLESVDKVLQARNSSVEKYLEAQLIKFQNLKIIHSLDDTLTFGQYTGMNVREICQTDLDYMYWLVIEQGSKKFKSEVADYIRQLANQEAGYL